MVANENALTADGRPSPYTAAWHHRHLYNPRSISDDSNMPPYRFLYVKRRIGQAPSPNAVNFVGDESNAPAQGWEIVPSYDARCLVAYLMSRDQSHPLKEAKSPVVAAPAASPAKGAPAK
jgi:cytochrome c oxidase cbb3-type subunit 2